MTTLSAEQEAGIEEIRKWYTDALDGMRGCFRLFGPAGTGKTTMAKHIPGALGQRAKFMTFTGKAAHVLQRKGVAGAKTIHSSIYYPVVDEDAKAALQQARKEVAEMEHSVTVGDWESAGWASEMELAGALDEAKENLDTLSAQTKRMSWEWNPDAMMEEDPGLLILDEVSMVNGRLAEDLERFGIPILVLGDPAQLPPVDGGGYYINGAPDFLLEEIHRQALESPVLELATRIRLSTGDRLGMRSSDTEPASLAAAMEHDQVITWSNKRRWAVITGIRNILQRPAGKPVEGDRIMCLTNNRDLSVFNGQQFLVTGVKEASLGPTLTLQDDDGHTRTIPTYADGFLGLEMEKQAKGSGSGNRGPRMLATFAQAITAHKAQGSEWGSVYVVNELPTMMWMETRNKGQEAGELQARRWLYTAVTRAADRVTITTPSRSR